MSGYSNIVQTRPNELVDILRPDLQHRNDPQFAAKTLTSAFLHLYGNRGVWYGGDVDEQLNCYDLTKQGRTMYRNADVELAVMNDIVCSLRFNPGAPADDRLFRADEPGLSITGTETYVPANRRGLTLGGWWRYSSVGTIYTGMMGKWDVGDESYVLTVDNASKAALFVENSVGANDNIVSDVTLTTDRWWYVEGVLDVADAKLRIHVGDSRDQYVVKEKATAVVDIADTDDFFCIGNYRMNANTGLYGWMSICHLAAAQSDEAELRWVWEQTRAMYPPTV